MVWVAEDMGENILKIKIKIIIIIIEVDDTIPEGWAVVTAANIQAKKNIQYLSQSNHLHISGAL